MTPHTPRPSLSITLPCNFESHYDDNQMPRTPDQQVEETNTMNPPPPPRPQAFKVRRRRAAIPEFQESEPLMSDTVIPTIEMSEAASEMSSPMLQPTPSSHGFLAPVPAFQRLVTPPKTPTPRINESFSSPVESPANEWALINNSRSKLRAGFERSGSVCSTFSDSSVSSCGSSAFSAPNNGSCTSPESETTDPFLDDELPKDNDKAVTSPDPRSSPLAKRLKTHRHIKWTQAMDDHLWFTYMQYLADPRVTPFKMLPGTCPPLGVCSRVASKAKRTWSSHRASTPGGDTLMTSDQRAGSPDTIRPETKESKQPQWPRSDSNTRRRLRSLCKRKPSLSAHYQRLLHTRSPSPFASSSSMGPASEPPPSAPSAFSSGDMKMSLVTATAPSMQPDGPLAQLRSDEVPRPQPQPQSQRSSRPTDWFARIPRSQAHQKSLSLQSELSLNTMTASAGMLASPFGDTTNRFHLLQSMSTTKSLGRSGFNKDGKRPSLESPVELSGAPTLPRTSLKRRFRPDDEKPKRPGLQDVFGPSAEGSGAVRNRGFTIGAARATDNLAQLFAPPAPAPTADHEMSDYSAVPASWQSSDLGPPGSRSAPRRLAEPVPRLGSPFTESQNRPFNTFPRSYVPSSNNPSPFEQRLRQLAAQGSAIQRR